MDVRSATNGPARVEYRVVRADGTWRWVSSNGGVERDADGNLVRHVGACVDITARRRDEETQRRSQKLEALGTLAGGIAHDFNNILLAISGNTRLAIADLPAGHPAQVSLHEVDKASQRAAQLVQRILAFSRQNEPQREILPLRPIVEEALQLLRSTLPAMIEIRTSYAPDLPNVSADATQIHQIVMNLITNAAHAIGETARLRKRRHCKAAADARGRARRTATCRPVNTCAFRSATPVSASVPRRWTESSIRSSRRSLPARALDSASASCTASCAVSVVRSRSRARPAQGALFRLYFPAVDREVTGPQVRESLMPGRGQRIMYIDDEDALVFLAKRTLERLGYTVSGFVDPVLALEAFKETLERSM